MNPRLKSVMDKLANADLPTFAGVAMTGANVKGSSFGDTPLHIMAIWGDVEAAKILIEEGAEIEARGEDAHTPLHEAVSQGKIEIVKLLLQHGANPWLRSNYGDAFELADYVEHPELKEILKNEN